jgi:ketosteroid isomerase-like protein
MNVKEIATRLTALCREGKYEAAQEELFSKDAVSVEPENSPGLQTVKGLEAIKEKGRHFQSMVEAVHSNTISDPVVAGNTFAVSMIMDVTMKGVGRVPMEEIVVYTVQDGKVAREEFFYKTN